MSGRPGSARAWPHASGMHNARLRTRAIGATDRRTRLGVPSELTDENGARRPELKSRWTPLLVFLAACAWFAIALPARDLWTTAEHRYAEVARELLAPGHDHVVPHLNASLYPDKPPGWFWVAGALHPSLGLDLALASRLPSVIGAAFIVLLTFLLARRWWGTASGCVAAGIVATADLFDWAARSGQLDTWLSVFIVLSLFCILRAKETEQPSTRRAWTFCGYLSVGMGILIKGPAAVLIPVAVIVAYVAWTRQARLLLTWALLWGAVVAALPGLVWVLAARERAGDAYVHEMLVGHAIGHAAGQVDKLEPWYYYLWAVPLSLLPWTAFLPAALRRNGTADEKRVDPYLLAWLLTPVLVFSLSPAKRDLYLIAVHPAAALLVARLFRDGPTSEASRREAWTSLPLRVLAAASAIAGTAVVAVAIVALVRGRAGIGIESIQTQFFGDRYASWRFIAAFVLGASANCFGIASWRAPSAQRAAGTLIGSVASLMLLNALVLVSARDADQSPRKFLEDVRARVGDAPLGRLGDDGGLQYAVNWVLERDHVPEFHKGAAADAFLTAGPEPRYVVTDDHEIHQFGQPVNGVALLRLPRRRAPELILLGNAAAAGR